MRSSATVPTANGRRYLLQLVKHFAHKASASLDAREGHIRFAAGELRLRAAADTLMLIAEAPAPDALDRLEQVVGRHLRRFAFREPDLAVDWSRPRRAPGM